MKYLIILTIFLASLHSVYASDLVFNFENFKRLPYEEKVKVVKTYQQLSAKVDESSKEIMKFKFSLNKREQFIEDFQTYTSLAQKFFLAEAYADSFDVNKKCAFAGWVANYDAKGLCNLTAIKITNKSNYNKAACSSSEIVCNPLLFGTKAGKPFCADAYLPGNRGASYKCMEQSTQAKNTKEIIANIMSSPQDFYRLALVLQRLCLCETDDQKKPAGQNKYRNRLHSSANNSTCNGLIKQLQILLNHKNEAIEGTVDNVPWFCAEKSFAGQANQKTMQNDLFGIKAIVDKLTDQSKYDETLKAVCGPAPVGGTSTGPGIIITDPGLPNPSSEVCTEDGDCEDEPVVNPPSTTTPAAITSGASVGLNLETSLLNDTATTAEVRITALECKDIKVPTDFPKDGCTLKWEMVDLASGAAIELEGVLSYTANKAATEFTIQVTLSDGKDSKVSTQTIPALEKSSDTETTTDAAIEVTDGAIDLDDTAPPPPGAPQMIFLPPSMMFIMPGVN